MKKRKEILLLWERIKEEYSLLGKEIRKLFRL